MQVVKRFLSVSPPHTSSCPDFSPEPTVPAQGSDFTGIMQVFMIVLRCLIALYGIPQSSIALDRAMLFQVRCIFNLAFLWSDCPKLRCMHVFVDERTPIRNEVIINSQ